MVLIGIHEGDGGVSAVDVAFNLCNSGDIFIEVGGNIPHHVDGA